MTDSSRNVQKAWLSSVRKCHKGSTILPEFVPPGPASIRSRACRSLLVDKRDTPHEDPLKAKVRERKQAPSACAHATTRLRAGMVVKLPLSLIVVCELHC
jgi:hypothetical protein